MAHTRITVPFSEAVARSVPVELMERKEMGDLCAWITLATVKERVEKRRTSPDWEVVDVVGGDADDGWVERGEVGDGTGEGYARYEASADGDKEHIAARKYGCQMRDGVQRVTCLLGSKSSR
jgi:hypothetical protein